MATGCRRPNATNEEDESSRERRMSAEKNEKQFIIPSDEKVQGHELENDVIEKILARLPVAHFFRFRSVCRGWNLLVWSSGFLECCREVPRKPWFYMLGAKSAAGVVYDTETLVWRHINLPVPTGISGTGTTGHQIPVAASNGLMCFRSSNSQLTTCNLLTGLTRSLPALNKVVHVLAIAMCVVGTSYNVIIACGKAPLFGIKVFSSTDNSWKEIPITGAYEFATNKTAEENESGAERLLLKRGVLQRNEFLQGGGIIHRNPAKVLSGITAVNHHGHRVIYFLNLNGRMVAFNIHEGTMCMCPRILPSEMEYSIDLVECGGRVLLVVLVEMMESASLRVWEFDWGEGEWKQLMAMPPAMSNVYYGKMVDINCVGYEDLIMMCISSRRFHQVVMCNISEGTWTELPKCFEPGTRTPKKFVSAYCFEPRIEARV
ncbi:hypothetical protein MRB53_005897 [Persea americana]|uniref:Uncharacterized protein n=1 Tax=Persea americana TaxID=3435 RepID=A0ACC2MEV3_PERAE|nr:hypothetical protein MRB53_005897 [Persea americana]